MKEHFRKKFTKTLLITMSVLFVLNIFLWISRVDPNKEINNERGDKGGPVKVFSEITKHVLLSNEERVFLVLFQNNMELRPGGGFIGSFGVVKTKNKKIVDFAIHDTGNFDGRIPSTIKPPYPMGEMLHIDSWKLRDSNYSPNFPTNAKKVEEFYYMGSGKEKFDGVIAVNASVLESILGVLGPISLVEGSEEFNKENVLIALEKQVEVDYVEQGIEKGDRKKIMNNFLDIILNRVEKLSLTKKMQLVKVFVNELDRKNIQLYFKNNNLQEAVRGAGWAGEVNGSWDKDYLMIVDANLGGYKSDHYMKRNISYTIDLSEKKPVVSLKITHHHTAKKKDWMTNDWQGYMRVYVPENAWLFDDTEMEDNIQYGREFGRKYFGKKIFVPIGATEVAEFKYYLSDNNIENYDFLLQKQSGVKNVSLDMTIKYPNGTEKKVEKSIKKDFILSENI